MAVIKHIVLPGGGPSGIQTLGALQHLEKNGYWNIQNIESIYATSVGCIIAILLALNFDWLTINDYIIKRPWHEATHLNINQVFNMFSKKGFYDVSIMHLFFKPFFDSRDISLKITFKEFFDMTKVDLHFFSLDVNSFAVEDFCFQTMPDAEILSCAYMSASIPLLFSPICINGKCYIDGGVLTNYPIKQCVERVGEERLDEILGIKNCYIREKTSEISSDSTLLEFMMSIISNLIQKCQKTDSDSNSEIPYEVFCECQQMSLNYLQETIKSQQRREELLQSGIKFAEKFVECHPIKT